MSLIKYSYSLSRTSSAQASKACVHLNQITRVVRSQLAIFISQNSESSLINLRYSIKWMKCSFTSCSIRVSHQVIYIVFPLSNDQGQGLSVIVSYSSFFSSHLKTALLFLLTGSQIGLTFVYLFHVNIKGFSCS